MQYEIVFLDPNDDLGYGKRMNMEKVGIREFQANQSDRDWETPQCQIFLTLQ